MHPSMPFPAFLARSLGPSRDFWRALGLEQSLPDSGLPARHTAGDTQHGFAKGLSASHLLHVPGVPLFAAL